jgi:hypothetical protein
MIRRWLAALILLWASPSIHATEVAAPRHHAYAFDQPELLATQRTFGVGNAVTLLGEACADDQKAADSYAEWGEVNQPVLEQMTLTLAVHYRIPEESDDLQRRVAETMHLKTSISLSGSALTEACSSLPQTLALERMNLDLRYQAVLKEVSDPDYLKPRRTPRPPGGAPAADTLPPEAEEPSHDREEQTRSE